ncbi:hypothetical protein N0V88_003250 [Collariella sp. IMI 366227]|nr:hypothetical protein N0V88_003250 [Collariella sp. IMI 366227]
MSAPGENTNTNQPQGQNPEQNPSLWASHAEWIKGAAESTIGTITGSQSWRTSGEHDKEHARASMQAAVERRDPAKDGYGRAEEIAGKLTGCEGMKHEGAVSKNAGKPRRD